MTKRMMTTVLLVSTGVLSAVSLALEITLTNVYGFLLAYSYVPIVISMAIFGIGVGAFFSYRLYQRASHLTKPRDQKGLSKQDEPIETSLPRATQTYTTIGGLFAIDALLYFLFPLLLSHFPYLNQLAVYMIASAVPFVVFGWALAVVFRELPRFSALVYGVDLAGDTLGVLGSLYLMNRVGGLYAFFWYSGLLGLSGVLLCVLAWKYRVSPTHSSKTSRTAIGKRAWAAAVLSLVSVIAAITVGVVGPTKWPNLGGDLNHVAGADPEKTLISVLQSTPEASIESTDWDAFSRTDVVSTADPTRKIIFEDGGAGSYMYKLNGDLSSVQSLTEDDEFLPIIMGPVQNSLVIGAGGGRDVLYSLLAGSNNVTAVELNPGAIRSMNLYAGYNGHLFQRPDVHVVEGDGRNFIERSSSKYNLIVLDLVYSQVSDVRSLALTENYIFTTQAFQSYLRHLTPDGRIVVISHTGLEGIKAFYTGFQAYMNLNHTSPKATGSHALLLMAPQGATEQGITLSVISRQPVTSKELQVVQSGTKALGLEPLFVPGSNEQFLKPLLDGKIPFQEFVSASSYNVTPTTDNQPYFFNVQKGLPGSIWQWFAVVLILTLLLALVMWIFQEDRVQKEHRALNWRRVGFFGAVGIGYLCLQLSLVEKFLLVLWNPVITTVVVLGGMLLGGGLGGWIAQKKWLSIRVIVTIVVALVLFELFGLNPLASEALKLPLGGAIALATVVVMVCGICLGLPFPTGLRYMEKSTPGASPAAFAVNGIASAWGSWVATIVSMSFGLQATICIGGLMYLLLLAFTSYRKELL